MKAEQYLKAILESIIRYPESLVIHTSTDEMGVLLAVSCHQQDMGALIGKAGETAKAIRHLVRIVGHKDNARVSVKFNEPEGSLHQRKLLEDAIGEFNK